MKVQASPTAYSTMAHGTEMARYIDDKEEDDEYVCRICRTQEDTDNNPLRYPCACRGSIKFVHQDCLLEWLSHSQDPLQCEVCKYHFSSSPLYDEMAPTRLPFNEFVVGTAIKVWRFRALHFFLLLSSVLLIWFLTVPFVTFWIWRLAFVRSFGEAQRLFLSHISSTTVVITDCLFGFLLYATVIVILRGATFLRIFFMYLIWMWSPLFCIKNAFIVLARTMKFFGVVIFVPFTLGRVILYHVTRPLYDVTTLSVGYMCVVFMVLIYFGIVALIRYFKGQPPLSLSFDRLYGVAASIVVTIPPLLRHLLIGIKFAYLFGVIPLMCGWLLDVCTVKMFGETMSHRVEILSVSHWVVGVLYLLTTIRFEWLLHEVIRPEILHFLNPAVTIEEPLHKIARAVFCKAAKFGSLIVLLVFLPVKLALIMAPSVFPLDISVSDPFTEIPASLLLFTICTQFMIKHFRLWTMFQSLVRCWFTGVGWALGLTDFLFPIPEDNGINVEPESAGNVEQSDSEYNSVPSVVLLLLAAWVTLLLLNTVLIVVPVSIGRAFINAIPTLPITHGIKCNDLYAFVIGTYAFWTTISGGIYVIDHVKSKRTSVLLNQICKLCAIVFKSSVLLVIWVVIIPVLIGLVFELLVIVPMRVPVDETPVFLLYQDWALGFIFLKIWTRLIIWLDDSWKAKFERVGEDGFSRLQGLWVLKEIVLPILIKLLTALCVPYVLARGVFPMLGYPLVVNSAVYRYAWIGFLSVRLLCFCAKRCHVWFRNLHDSIRDDRYLIGWRFHNFEEAVLTHQNQSNEEAEEGGVLIGSEEDSDAGLRVRGAIQQET